VHGSYGVWACVRDWIEEEMTSCGVGPRQLACFRFDERSREFHHYGQSCESNSDRREESALEREMM